MAIYAVYKACILSKYLSYLYKQIINSKLSLNEGMLYENAITRMLTAQRSSPFFYTHYNAEKKCNYIEIDFIISNNKKTQYKIYPIEVKSGIKYTTTSLLRFNEKYRSRIGGSYIIHTKNLTIKDDILCIPSYMTICF